MLSFVALVVVVACLGCSFTLSFAKTTLSIDGQNFKINGELTYHDAGNDHVPGLLLNSRMVQGVWDDYNSSTVDLWKYPDTKKWNADRNTDEFVGNMSLWKSDGLLAFTVGLQGGCPYGYCNAQPWIVEPYSFSTGALDSKFFNRMDKIITAADDLGMVVIVQMFYFGQVPRFHQNNNVIYAAIDNTMQHLLSKGYSNILIEVANECNIGGYGGTILDTSNIAKTIEYVQGKCNHKFPVGTSYGGGSIPSGDVISASDFVLLHGNGQSPSSITHMVDTVRGTSQYKSKPKPILFNEDDHYSFNSTSNNMKSAVDSHASWGYFLGCSGNDASNYINGYQCPPTAWDINTNHKGAFFEAVTEYSKP